MRFPLVTEMTSWVLMKDRQNQCDRIYQNFATLSKKPKQFMLLGSYSKKKNSFFADLVFQKSRKRVKWMILSKQCDQMLE